MFCFVLSFFFTHCSRIAHLDPLRVGADACWEPLDLQAHVFCSLFFLLPPLRCSASHVPLSFLLPCFTVTAESNSEVDVAAFGEDALLPPQEHKSRVMLNSLLSSVGF